MPRWLTHAVLPAVGVLALLLVVLLVVLLRKGTSPQELIVGTWEGPHPDDPSHSSVIIFHNTGVVEMPSAADRSLRRARYTFRSRSLVRLEWEGELRGRPPVDFDVEFPSRDELILTGPQWRQRLRRTGTDSAPGFSRASATGQGASTGAANTSQTAQRTPAYWNEVRATLRSGGLTWQAADVATVVRQIRAKARAIAVVPADGVDARVVEHIRQRVQAMNAFADAIEREAWEGPSEGGALAVKVWSAFLEMEKALRAGLASDYSVDFPALQDQ